MLSDHELHALREIERRLRWKSPELVRLFDGVEPLPDKSRGKRARAKMLVASAAFAGLALLGPRMLNEAETTAQRRPPVPQVSPSPLEPAPSVTTRVTVIDLSIGCVDHPCHRNLPGLRARHGHRRPLDRGADHSLSRVA